PCKGPRAVASPSSAARASMATVPPLDPAAPSKKPRSIRRPAPPDPGRRYTNTFHHTPTGDDVQSDERRGRFSKVEREAAPSLPRHVRARGRRARGYGGRAGGVDGDHLPHPLDLARGHRHFLRDELLDEHPPRARAAAPDAGRGFRPGRTAAVIAVPVGLTLRRQDRRPHAPGPAEVLLLAVVTNARVLPRLDDRRDHLLLRQGARR